jgi:hypothetical protein
MLRVGLTAMLLALAVACTAPMPLRAPVDPARDVATWPPADKALLTGSTKMSELQTLREHLSSRTYRNDEPFLAVDAERAYVAPDRRYEKMEGRSPVESVSGETVQIGARFFKRLNVNGPWQQFPWTESVVWPGGEYSFPGASNVVYEGAGDADGRPARILTFQHEGTNDSRNVGWQFQTRLWVDPDSGYFLRRETRGARQEPDPVTGKSLAQRYEATWTYLDHDGPITIADPIAAGIP